MVALTFLGITKLLKIFFFIQNDIVLNFYETRLSTHDFKQIILITESVALLIFES
jgi:hypothetical protein